MATQYNIVFICTDEQSRSTLGAYGNPLIHTPNIDRLANESLVFDRAYVTQPVCTASRSSIMTGLYPHSNGCTENNIPLTDDVRCFPELFNDDSRICGYIGKWHLGDEITPQHGFSRWVSIEDSYREQYRIPDDRSRRSDYDRFLRGQGYVPDVDTGDGVGMFSRSFTAHLPEDHTKAHFVGTESARFIEENRGRPFILFSNFLEPHMPFFGPRNEQYRDIDIPLPGSYDDDLVSGSLKSRLFAEAYLRRGMSGIDLTDSEEWRRLIRQYWGLVGMIDEQVGRILQAIESSGIADRTIIIYTSDHGDMMGAHSLVGKCVMYEEAVRVPLMMRLPPAAGAMIGVSRGRIRRPVSQIDLVPTALDLLGYEIPQVLEGRSLVPRSIPGGDENPVRSDGSQFEYPEDVVIEWNGMNSGFGDVVGDTNILPEWLELADEITIKAALDDPVRTLISPDGWKYTWSHRGEDQLFHLPTDPMELSNLVHEVDSDIVSGFRNRIERWQVRTLDPVVFG